MLPPLPFPLANKQWAFHASARALFWMFSIIMTSKFKPKKLSDSTAAICSWIIINRKWNTRLLIWNLRNSSNFNSNVFQFITLGSLARWRNYKRWKVGRQQKSASGLVLFDRWAVEYLKGIWSQNDMNNMNIWWWLNSIKLKGERKKESWAQVQTEFAACDILRNCKNALKRLSWFQNVQFSWLKWARSYLLKLISSMECLEVLQCLSVQVDDDVSWLTSDELHEDDSEIIFVSF